MGGYRDAAFGVYAKCGILRKVLKRRWAGKRPEDSVALLFFVSNVRCDDCGMAAKFVPSIKAPYQTIWNRIQWFLHALYSDHKGVC